MGFNSSQLNRVIEAKYLHLFLKSSNGPLNGAFNVSLLLFTDISRAMTSRTPRTSLQQTARGKSLTLPTLSLNSFVIYFDWHIFLSDLFGDLCFSACSLLHFRIITSRSPTVIWLPSIRVIGFSAYQYSSNEILIAHIYASYLFM